MRNSKEIARGEVILFRLNAASIGFLNQFWFAWHRTCSIIGRLVCFKNAIANRFDGLMSISEHAVGIIPMPIDSSNVCLTLLVRCRRKTKILIDISLLFSVLYDPTAIGYRMWGTIPMSNSAARNIALYQHPFNHSDEVSETLIEDADWKPFSR